VSEFGDSVPARGPAARFLETKEDGFILRFFSSHLACHGDDEEFARRCVAQFRRLPGNKSVPFSFCDGACV
jgi:hypothetical protein